MSDDSTTLSLTDTLRRLAARSSPGDRLPSSRDLVTAHQVSPVTVARAIARLAAEGVVVTRPGSGTYVAPRAHAESAIADTAWQAIALTDRSIEADQIPDALGPPAEGTIRLDGGYLHRSLQPTNLLASALARAARRVDAWDRAPTNGLTALRAVFASWVGGGTTAEDVLITSGGQSALSTAFRAIAAPGSPILMESPTYRGALAAARAAGLRPTPVPIDDAGLRPDLLAEAFTMTGARLLYCQPTFHNPTGTTLAAERRREVVQIARAAGAFLVEDDFARSLGHGGSLPPPLAADDRDGTVVYLTSLTKPAAPSMRIGAIVARGPVMRRLQAVRRVDDFFVARPLQEAALELLGSPSWERHAKTLSRALRQRCALAAASVTVARPEWTVPGIPAGGLHLWIRLAPGEDDLAVVREARTRGTAVDPGRSAFPAEAPGAYVRLAFAAAADETELKEGIRRLAGDG
ncbi:MAG: PLP-dependent aminotransferase family protein [Catenulispora sp.]|nr:PLP-dependent aminotransferase family protein [Catenulispora sp.]